MGEVKVEVVFDGRAGPKAAIITDSRGVVGLVWLLPWDPDYGTTKYRGAYRAGPDANFHVVAENNFAKAVIYACNASGAGLPELRDEWERDVSKFTKEDRKMIFMLAGRDDPEDNPSLFVRTA